MHRLLPRPPVPDTSAAASLLRWLTAGALFCLSALAALHLTAQFGKAAAAQRRTMEAAAYQAQRYFDQREALLNHLADAPPYAPAMAAAPRARADADADASAGATTAGAGSEQRSTALRLSAKTHDDLLALGVQVFDVAVDGRTGQRLQDLRGADMPLPAGPDMAALLAGLSDSERTTQVRWRASRQPGVPLLLYRAVDDGRDNARWRVMLLDPQATRRAIAGAVDGSAFLLDPRAAPVLASSARPLPSSWLQARPGDAFGTVWRHGLPDGIALTRGIGEDGWRLLYHLPGKALLQELGGQILSTVLLCAVAIVLLRALLRRWLLPAYARQQRLRDDLAFATQVIDTVPVGIRVLRRSDGAVLRENPLARDWLGIDVAAPGSSDSWHRLTGGAHPDGLATGPAALSGHDGRPLQLLCVRSRYRDEEVLLCVLNDVSQQQRVQTALSAATQAAERASRAKSRFVATMSHEIRTPLYGMLGTLELLAHTRLDERQTQHLQIIQKSSSVLLQLISDTLDIARIESGLVRLAPRPFSPLDLAEATLRSYADAAARKQLRILVCTDPCLPAQVIGDVDRLRQVLGNLLGNAIKFTDSGHIFLRVHVLSCTPHVASIRWQVSDTGIGIAAADQRHLFRPFHQINGAGTPTGSGLGLAICDQLVRLMEGTLQLVSAPGQGSTFSVDLPLPLPADGSAVALTDTPRLRPSPPVYVRASVTELVDNACRWLRRWGATALPYQPGLPVNDPHAILLDSDPGDAPAEWPGPQVITSADGGDPAVALPAQPHRLQVTLFSIRAIAHAIARLQTHDVSPATPTTQPWLPPLALRVLIAEDNPINQLILTEQLQALGCQVVCTADGNDAWAACQQGGFDLVLTDINMPGLDGPTLARRLRTQGFDLPVLGISADATPEERRRCIAAGMDAYLVKPVGLEALHRALAGASAPAQPATTASASATDPA